MITLGAVPTGAGTLTRRARGALLAACCVVATLATSAAQGLDLSAAEARGKRIYREGLTDGDVPLMALVGRGDTPVPASALPCAGCHGADGTGRPEGGVVPSEITWRHLVKQYGHDHSYGRRHPAFTEQTLAQAIKTGTDPGDNRLDPAMPRYLLPERDMADLIAYLKQLEFDRDPGLAADVIRVGTVLPLSGPMQATGLAMRELLTAYFDALNATGGIYGRKVELTTVDYRGDRQSRAAAVRELVEGGDVFALVSPFIVGLEDEFAGIAETARVPIVGPFTLFPEHDGFNQYTFYVFPGLPGEARALVEYASTGLEAERRSIAVIKADGHGYDAAAAAAEAQARQHAWRSIMDYAEPADGRQAEALVEKLAAPATQAVLYLGTPAGLGRLLAAMRGGDWQPYLLLSSALAGRWVLQLPGPLSKKIYFAFPTLPGDRTAAGENALAELAAASEPNGGHRAAQTAAYTAALVLVEGLRRSGRSLSRESLVKNLEALHRFDTGLTKPVSFGPNRRVGVLGAHIAAVDTEKRTLLPVGEWVPLD